MHHEKQEQINNLHYQSLFNNSRDGIYRSTPEGKYIDANPALVKMLGYDSKEELLALNIPEKVYFNGTKRPSAQEREAIFTTQLKKKNGELIWAEINSWVIKAENGQTIYYEGIVRDITQRRQFLKELYNSKEQLQITLESIGDGVIVTDVKGRVVMLNECAEKLTAYKQEEVQGRFLTDVFNIINEYSRKPVKNPVEKVINSGKIEGLANHTILISKEGKETAISDSAAPIKDKNGNITGIVMVFRDVSEKQEMIRRLKANEEKYRTLFENTGTAMAIIGEDSKIMILNNEMEELLGFSRQELEGKKTWHKLINNPLDLKRIKEYQKLITKKTRIIMTPKSCEFALTDKKGQNKYVLARVSQIKDTKKSIVSLIDISERKRFEERIKYLGYHDELTGLYNRNFFKESIERIDTNRQLPISIIMGDVNGLKLINDGFGHQKGDELIKIIAEIIKKSCRGDDIIARWGGDEFVILLPQTTGSDAEKVIKRINNGCKNVEYKLLKPSIALGYATKTKKEESLSQILKEAEKWVYKRKLVESQSVRSSIINSLEEALLEKNYETREHTTRVKELVVRMGEALDLPSNRVDELILLASLHDIGKIAIPDNILMNADSLNNKEWETMKKHPEIGYRIAQSCSELASVSEAILYHHEWWNGEGYPQGFKGKDIPLNSRIIAIVDAYDVMLHDRPYKKGIYEKEAIKELKKYAGIQFDPNLVEIFIKKVLNN